MPDNAREVPQDVPAEAVALGSMLIDPPCVPAVREILRVEDFFRPAHQLIYAAICYMHDHPARWGVPDLVTLRRALAERGKLDAVGGVEYLAEIVDYVPSAANVMYYAEIVKRDAQRRAAIIAGHELANAAYSRADDDGAAIRAAAQAVEAATRPPVRRNGQSSSADLRERIESAIAGRRESLSWPWPTVTRRANPAAPAAVTILCGEPGSGKSLLFQQSMLAWHRRGVKTAMLHLEKNREYHQLRALAQLSAESGITSDRWQKANPDHARAIEAEHRDVIDSYGATVWDDPDGSMSLEQVRAWIAARAADGARVVGVDPITAAEPGPKPWEADRRFIVACQAIAARHNCTIVLVTHPRTIGVGAPNMDQLAGGRAYSRLVDCVLWLQGHNPPEEGSIKYQTGEAIGEYNRSIALCKTRDGAGQGVIVALDFSGESLTAGELGPIRKQARKARTEK